MTISSEVIFKFKGSTTGLKTAVDSAVKELLRVELKSASTEMALYKIGLRQDNLVSLQKKFQEISNVLTEISNKSKVKFEFTGLSELTKGLVELRKLSGTGGGSEKTVSLKLKGIDDLDKANTNLKNLVIHLMNIKRLASEVKFPFVQEVAGIDKLILRTAKLEQKLKDIEEESKKVKKALDTPPKEDGLLGKSNKNTTSLIAGFTAANLAASLLSNMIRSTFREITKAISDATDQSLKFEQQITRLRIVTQNKLGNNTQTSQAVLNAAGDVNANSTEAGAGIETIFSAGVDKATDAIEMYKQVQMASLATGADFNDLMNTAIIAQNSFGVKLEDVATVLNKVAVAATNSKLSIKEFATQTGGIFAETKSYVIGMDELLAMYGMTGNFLRSGADASVATRAILQKIAQPSVEAEDIARSINKSTKGLGTDVIFSASAMTAQDGTIETYFKNFITKLRAYAKKESKNVGDLINTMFHFKASSKGLNVMIEGLGSGSMAKFKKRIHEDTDFIKKAYDEIMSGILQKWINLQNSIGNLFKNSFVKNQESYSEIFKFVEGTLNQIIVLMKEIGVSMGIIDEFGAFTKETKQWGVDMAEGIKEAIYYLGNFTKLLASSTMGIIRLIDYLDKGKGALGSNFFGDLQHAYLVAQDPQSQQLGEKGRIAREKQDKIYQDDKTNSAVMSKESFYDQTAKMFDALKDIVKPYTPSKRAISSDVNKKPSDVKTKDFGAITEKERLSNLSNLIKEQARLDKIEDEAERKKAEKERKRQEKEAKIKQAKDNALKDALKRSKEELDVLKTQFDEMLKTEEDLFEEKIKGIKERGEEQKLTEDVIEKQLIKARQEKNKRTNVILASGIFSTEAGTFNQSRKLKGDFNDNKHANVMSALTITDAEYKRDVEGWEASLKDKQRANELYLAKNKLSEKELSDNKIISLMEEEEVQYKIRFDNRSGDEEKKKALEKIRDLQLQINKEIVDVDDKKKEKERVEYYKNLSQTFELIGNIGSNLSRTTNEVGQAIGDFLNNVGSGMGKAISLGEKLSSGDVIGAVVLGVDEIAISVGEAMTAWDKWNTVIAKTKPTIQEVTEASMEWIKTIPFIGDALYSLTRSINDAMGTTISETRKKAFEDMGKDILKLSEDILKMNQEIDASNYELSKAYLENNKDTFENKIKLIDLEASYNIKKTKETATGIEKLNGSLETKLLTIEVQTAGKKAKLRQDELDKIKTLYQTEKELVLDLYKNQQKVHSDKIKNINENIATEKKALTELRTAYNENKSDDLAKRIAQGQGFATALNTKKGTLGADFFRANNSDLNANTRKGLGVRDANLEKGLLNGLAIESYRSGKAELALEKYAYFQHELENTLDPDKKLQLQNDLNKLQEEYYSFAYNKEEEALRLEEKKQQKKIDDLEAEKNAEIEKFRIVTEARKTMINDLESSYLKGADYYLNTMTNRTQTWVNFAKVNTEMIGNDINAMVEKLKTAKEGVTSSGLSGTAIGNMLGSGLSIPSKVVSPTSSSSSWAGMVQGESADDYINRIKKEDALANFKGTSSIRVPSSYNHPSYAVGTNNVPKTGLAMIHKGEMIIPAGVSEGIRRQQMGNSNYNSSSQNVVFNSNFTIIANEQGTIKRELDNFKVQMTNDLRSTLNGR